MIWDTSEITIFLCSLALSLLVMGPLERLGTRGNLVDHPSRRKVHSSPTPLVGGMGIMLAVSVSHLLLAEGGCGRGVWYGLGVLLFVGVLDDIFGLGHRVKFLAQVMAVFLLIRFSGVQLHNFGNLLFVGDIKVPLGWPVTLVTIFCATGLINAINMIDGLDALAGGVSFIAFISFALLNRLAGLSELTIFCLAFAGAILGFLRFNWPPARLFMGDAGSLVLGFSLLFVAVQSTQAPGSMVRPVTALIILGIPIIDTLTLMTRRVMSGRSPFVADRYHLHHILMRIGLSKTSAVCIILFLSLVTAILAILGVICRIPDYWQFTIFMAFFAAYFAMSFWVPTIIRRARRIFMR